MFIREVLSGCLSKLISRFLLGSILVGKSRPCLIKSLEPKPYLKGFAYFTEATTSIQGSVGFARFFSCFAFFYGLVAPNDRNPLRFEQSLDLA